MDDNDFPLRLHDHLLLGRALRLGSDRRTGGAAEAGAEDCTIAPADGRTDRGTGAAANRPAEHGATYNVAGLGEPRPAC